MMSGMRERLEEAEARNYELSLFQYPLADDFLGFSGGLDPIGVAMIRSKCALEISIFKRERERSQGLIESS